MNERRRAYFCTALNCFFRNLVRSCARAHSHTRAQPAQVIRSMKTALTEEKKAKKTYFFRCCATHI